MTSRAGWKTALSLGLLLSATACAPREQPAIRPAAEPQLGANAFTAADGALLPLQRWLPSTQARAVVLALHGFDDYHHAFEETGARFAEHGIITYAYDQRGFGSAPMPGIWGGEDNMVADIRACAGQLKKQYPNVPFYVMGESMGAALAMIALSEADFPKVNGLILESPAVWGNSTMNPLYRSVLWLGAHTVPYNRVTGSDLHILASNNIPMLRRMAKDPLVIKKTRIDAIYGLVGTMDDAYNDIPLIHAPVLLLYGGRDQVIPRDPVRQALKRFTVPVKFVFYPGGYHMLIRDVEGAVVQEDIISWIAHPDAPLPSGLGKLHPAPVAQGQ